MATGTQPQSQQSSTTSALQQPPKRFLGGYIDPNDGIVRLVTDPSKLHDLRLQTCANARW